MKIDTYSNLGNKVIEALNVPKSKMKNIKNNIDIIDFVKNHFIAQYANNFLDEYNIKLHDLSRILTVSLKTLQRNLNNNQKQLKPEISEQFFEIAEIYILGENVLEGKEKFNEWLERKNLYFNNDPPKKYLSSHMGRELLKRELLKIEFGSFS